ncbi:MAG: hypothetical protein IT204_08500 [Fimbriimonadaceae bacterium]|nr:hypothetical protein [Fimbriimonadaceae bacterium]
MLRRLSLASFLALLALTTACSSGGNETILSLDLAVAPGRLPFTGGPVTVTVTSHGLGNNSALTLTAAAVGGGDTQTIPLTAAGQGVYTGTVTLPANPSASPQTWSLTARGDNSFSQVNVSTTVRVDGLDVPPGGDDQPPTPDL